MPNGSAHIIAGTICGAASSLVIQSRAQESKQIDLGHLLISTGTGAAVSRLPDILEPAIHPNHRAFFHSFVFGALLGFGSVETWKKIKMKAAERRASGIEEISLAEIFLGLILIVIVVVFLHLMMDGFTKKGLPVI